MSTNPYESPQSTPSGSSLGASPTARAMAIRAVRPPAIALLSASILWLVGMAAAICFDLFVLTASAFDQEAKTDATIRLVGGLVLVAVHIFMLFGAIQMLKLRSYQLAKACSILAMIPCFSACYLLGIPFGIWAMVVLVRPEVKAAFD